MKKTPAMTKTAKYISIIIGAGILAFGLYNVHSRCAVTEGGALGLSLLLQHWFRISPAVSSFVMDLAALIAGAVILRSTFLIDSIIAAAAYSLWYGLFELMDPVLPDLSGYPLAAAVVGAIFVGVGAGLIVKHGCAGSADDALALIVNRKTGLALPIFYVISDFTVLLLSLSYIPLVRIAWSMLTVLISSWIIGLICPNPRRE